jgi:hypothetical protein
VLPTSSGVPQVRQMGWLSSFIVLRVVGHVRLPSCPLGSSHEPAWVPRPYQCCDLCVDPGELGGPGSEKDTASLGAAGGLVRGLITVSEGSCSTVVALCRYRLQCPHGATAVLYIASLPYTAR